MLSLNNMSSHGKTSLTRGMVRQTRRKVNCKIKRININVECTDAAQSEVYLSIHKKKKKKNNKLHGLSPRANYTDRATAACRRSDCQLVRIEGATWSA
jgi:hypothetical protein